MSSENRDGSYLYHLNEHYFDMVTAFNGLTDYQAFHNGGYIRKAILFDLFQIGECVAHLSSELRKKTDGFASNKIISIRNIVVHGYDVLDDEIVYDVIKNRLPAYVEKLNLVGLDAYHQTMEALLGKTIDVSVMYYAGKTYDGLLYPLNYGQYAYLIAPNGIYQGAYVVGEYVPHAHFSGRVIAIIRKPDSLSDSLVVSKGAVLSKEEIIKAVAFKETCTADDIILAE